MPHPPRKASAKGQAKKLTDAQKARQKDQRDYRRKLARIIANDKRAQERSLKATLKTVKGKGIYEPKSLELTPYRRKRARKVQREYGDFLNPLKFLFVSVPVESRAKVFDRAKALGISTTKDGEGMLSKIGLFIRRGGYTSAKLITEKKSGEAVIVRSGKIKRGPHAGRRYTSKLPLASLDELEREKERLIAMGTSFGPLKKNEQLSFAIHDGDKNGYSHSTFSDISLLLNHINNYQMSKAGMINYLRHVEIHKIESSNKWFKVHPNETSAMRRKRIPIRYKVWVQEPSGSEFAKEWHLEGDYKSFREASAVSSSLRKRGYKAKIERYQSGE